MATTLTRQAPKQRILLLFAVAAASILLWQTYWGSLLLYPFTILATWFHEMGHGLAALLTGARFDRLLIFPNGSGLALYAAEESRLTSAFVAAAGPLGPAIAGALLIVASRTPRSTRTALTLLGAALIVSTLVWVRSLIGWLVLPAMGIAILAIAHRASPAWQRLAIQVLGVQACISAWQQFDYLFSSSAVIGGTLHRSDTGAIADALFLPYWLWGAIISAAIAALIWASFRAVFRR